MVSKPKSIVNGACILMEETEKSKQETVLGRDEGSEVKRGRVRAQVDMSAP